MAKIDGGTTTGKVAKEKGKALVAREAREPASKERFLKSVDAGKDVKEPKAATKVKNGNGPCVTLKPCECGCGAVTKGGRFKPGHDARYHGHLLTASRLGDPKATATLKALGWA